jgi:hypothetical protein
VSAGKRLYVETSHTFSKGIGELMFQAGISFVPMFVLRDLKAVAESFLQIGSVPARTAQGRSFLLDPWAPHNMLWVGAGAPDAFCLCAWYAAEMFFRQLYFFELHRTHAQKRSVILYCTDLTPKQIYKAFAQCCLLQDQIPILRAKEVFSSKDFRNAKPLEKSISPTKLEAVLDWNVFASSLEVRDPIALHPDDARALIVRASQDITSAWTYAEGL